MNRRAALLAAAAILAGCGREPEAKPSPETAEYQGWKRRHTVVPAAGFAPTVAGEVRVLAAEDRSRGPDDFCEIYINGSPLYKCRMARLPDGTWPECRVDAVFRVGPNKIDLWDSTSNRNYRHDVDTRLGTQILFWPTPEGYDFSQSKKE